MPNGNNTYQTAPDICTRMKDTGACTSGQRMLVAALFFWAFMLAGCGGPAIDASTAHSMQSSIEHIRSTLSAEDTASFDIALIELNDMLFNRTDAVSQATISMYRPDALLRKILHDKTARDVIDMVEEHRQKKRE